MTARVRRLVLGLAGKPGAGKSTIATEVVAALGDRAVLVPMDGFHRYQADLDRLGRADRKGAPDTFDVDGYVAMLERLRADPDEPVPAPAFDREREDPVPDAIVVLPSHRVVVTEGNYLLHDGDGWERVRPLLDECWFVDGDDEVRVARLIARHVEFGRPPAAATAWVRRSDEANARLVEASRHRSDRIVRPGAELDALIAGLRR